MLVPLFLKLGNFSIIFSLFFIILQNTKIFRKLLLRIYRMYKIILARFFNLKFCWPVFFILIDFLFLSGFLESSPSSITKRRQRFEKWIGFCPRVKKCGRMNSAVSIRKSQHQSLDNLRHQIIFQIHFSKLCALKYQTRDEAQTPMNTIVLWILYVA